MRGRSLFISIVQGGLALSSIAPCPTRYTLLRWLYPFRFRDPVSGRVRARCFAERHEIDARYAVWEIIGEPEHRRPLGAMFNPWR